MKTSLIEIIDKYKRYDDLYGVLNNYITNSNITEENYNSVLDAIKNAITNYYLHIYEYKGYITNDSKGKITGLISNICDLEKKIHNVDGKVKIYPVNSDFEEKYETYKSIVEQMVDYQIKTDLDIESIFSMTIDKLTSRLENYKNELKEAEMLPYYGTPHYMIGRAKFIIERAKEIPNFNMDTTDITNKLASFEGKYITEDDYMGIKNPDSEFYNFYDQVELCYKKALTIEEILTPIVVESWKDYLSTPNENNNNFKYISHTFTNGMVNPDKMVKACCTLRTDDISTSIKNGSGLLYDIDSSSIETICTGDVGSWAVDKSEFIDNGCPARWQLTDVNNSTFWYEETEHSKLITPTYFEKIVKEDIKNNCYGYSEILLNRNAKAIGVFYDENCKDLEKVERYAKENNLPLVDISLRTKEMSTNEEISEEKSR